MPEQAAAAVRASDGRQAPPLSRRLYEDGDQAGRAARLLPLLLTLHSACWLPFYLAYSFSAHLPAAPVPYHVAEIM